MCKWKPKSKYLPPYECHEPPLTRDPKGYCILHSEMADKDINEFEKKVEERITKGTLTPSGWEINKIDLVGCCFPGRFRGNYFEGRKFDRPVYFSDATFSEVAIFNRATFSEVAIFNGATFSEEADFSDTTFSEVAIFNRATFSEAHFILATFSEQADFSNTTFSKAAIFKWATFSEVAIFNGATFSEEADFRWATFKKFAMFLKTSFRERVVFAWTIFEDSAGFNGTAFKGDTDFEWAEFRGWTFFFKNSRLTYARPEKRLRLDGIAWPESVRSKITYGEFFNFLTFEGIMSQDEKGELLRVPVLAQDDSYRKAICELHDLSQITTLGRKSSFHYARFEGERIRFQEVDLSNASFLHSNIDKVDFRYCSFGDKDEKLLGFIPHRRQNVLKDEIDADNDVGAGLAPAPTGKGVKEEKYEHVRRLYLELKKNFEEKRDWNTAGDFHYGEMECRRKMYGWSTFEGILVNTYFWLSGYGERPLRAAVSLGLLIGLCTIFYMYFEGLTFLKSGCDSLKIATLQRIGEVDEPISIPAKAVFMFESIMGPILIALLALALRRKVKR